MFHIPVAFIGTAAMERATLLANHIIGSEVGATSRLKAHAGRNIQLQFGGWPRLLPPLPNTGFRVTPAGLLEWREVAADAADADLFVAVDASNPALAMVQALTGERPSVEISGDAAFAADLNWLIDNLRWDMEDDLARIVSPAAAREISRIAGGVASGLRQAVGVVGGIAKRSRDGARNAPGR